MNHILCHSIIAYLTMFPGLIFLFLKKESIYIYTTILAIVNMINGIWFKEWIMLALLVLIIITPLLLYKLEKTIIEKKVHLPFTKLEMSGLCVIFFVPLFEELIFRYFLYKHIKSATFIQLNINFVFLFLSTATFLVAHIKKLKIKAIYKSVFAVGLSGIFLVTKEIWVCIIIHMIFNGVVYLSRIPKMERAGGYD